MKKITVFTPTFNRAYCIDKLYNSLIAQTSKDFIWLVVDDGSSDNTEELIQKWQKENKIEIRYMYQNNQGMHGAHNTAYANIDTELNVCIDSDDYMPHDAIEIILYKWEELRTKKNIAGILGLDIDKKANIIGTEIPNDIKYSTLYDIYNKYKLLGDKKLVLKTDIVKKYPKYPLFKNERFVPLNTLYLMIDQDYKLACLNKPLCVVEYMEDGSTLNIFKQYKNNPKGFRYARKIELTYETKLTTQIKKVLHLISSTLFIGDYKFFEDNPKKLLTFVCLPIGLLFHSYIKYKSNKQG